MIMYNQMPPPATAQVVSIPLRGRCNPYWYYLLPLIILLIAACLLTLGALITTQYIPYKWTAFEDSAPQSYKAARIFGLIAYSIVFIITFFMSVFYWAAMYNCKDSQCAQITLDIFNVVSILMLVPISIILIVAEALLNPQIKGYVNTGSLLVAGVLGLSAACCLVFALFFSRFYQITVGAYKYQKREILENGKVECVV